MLTVPTVIRFAVLSLLSSLSLLVLFSAIGQTQESGACYLRGANGQSVDLGKLCGSSQPLPQTKTVSQGVYQIPIKRRVGNIPVIEVIVNGQYHLEMLFDTGASSIVLNKNVADQVGLSYGEEVAIVHTAGGKVASPVGKIDSLQAGQLRVRDLEVMVTPKLGDISGLLGQPFYAQYDVTIKKDMIELRPR